MRERDGDIQADGRRRGKRDTRLGRERGEREMGAMIIKAREDERQKRSCSSHVAVVDVLSAEGAQHL